MSLLNFIKYRKYENSKQFVYVGKEIELYKKMYCVNSRFNYTNYFGLNGPTLPKRCYVASITGTECMLFLLDEDYDKNYKVYLGRCSRVEKSGLAYKVGCSDKFYFDGFQRLVSSSGYNGFMVFTSRREIDALIIKFEHKLKSKSFKVSDIGAKVLTGSVKKHK